MPPGRPNHGRVTLSDVGKYCGVHRTTVGLALRNDPSIPTDTRDRILKAVEELGYRPDPALSSLVAYRHQKSGTSFHSTIALVSDSDYGVKYWRSQSHIGMEQYLGLSEQAEKLGYKLEEYSVGQDRSHCRRVKSILRARGINSVIVTGLTNLDDPIDLDWERLCGVSMSYSLSSPAIPRVTTQHRANAALAVRHLIEHGYQRIGLATSFENDKRVDHAWSAGFLSACYIGGDALSHYSIHMTPGIPATVDLASKETLEWIRENGLQAVICTQQHVFRFLTQSGLRIPEDLGFVSLDLSNNHELVAGINQNVKEIGRQAVRIIASMQTSNQTGIPDFQQVHLVRGVWCEGKTLQRFQRSSSPAAPGSSPMRQAG